MSQTRFLMTSGSQFGSQEWLMKRAVFSGMLPSMSWRLFTSKMYTAPSVWLPWFFSISAMLRRSDSFLVIFSPTYSMTFFPLGTLILANTPVPWISDSRTSIYLLVIGSLPMRARSVGTRCPKAKFFVPQITRPGQACDRASRRSGKPAPLDSGGRDGNTRRSGSRHTRSRRMPR